MKSDPYRLLESKTLQIALGLCIGVVLGRTFPDVNVYFWALIVFFMLALWLANLPMRLQSILRSMLFLLFPLSLGVLLVGQFQKEMDNQQLPSNVSSVQLKTLLKDNGKSRLFKGVAQGVELLIRLPYDEGGSEEEVLQGDFKVKRIVNRSADFDFQAYYYWQGIQFQIQVRERDIASRTLADLPWWQQYRIALKQAFEQKVKDAQILGVFKALVFGDKSSLDKHIKDQFQRWGVVHVLAISGLHLGIFLWMVQLMFKQFPRNIQSLNAISLVVQLLMLWYFVYLSGNAASVTRAAIMFSFWVLGQDLQWKVLRVDALGASAILMILIAPESVFHLGFQMSYLAVFGILFYYPMLRIKSKGQKSRVLTLGLKCWDFTAVGFAAQSFLLPLILYHFGQLPLFFWVFNMVAVPGVTLILYLLLPLTFGFVFIDYSQLFLELAAAVFKGMMVLMNYLEKGLMKNLDLNLSLGQSLILGILIFLLPYRIQSDRWKGAWILFFLLFLYV